MAGTSSYELFQAPIVSDDAADVSQSPWRTDDEPQRDPPLEIGGDDGIVWATVAGDGGGLRRVEEPDGRAIGLQVVQRRLSQDLVMLTNLGGVLVNGVPALRLSVLGTKDSVRLGAGELYYVTQRITPHVGQPTEDMFGQKCPVCAIKIDKDTSVVTCQCSEELYHDETVESHPDVDGQDRLDCFEKIKTCLSCGREVTSDEYLVWNPTEI